MRFCSQASAHQLCSCALAASLNVHAPIPVCRARSRFVGPVLRRRTGLSAATRHNAGLRAGLLPVRRGMRHPCRMKSRARVISIMCKWPPHSPCASKVPRSRRGVALAPARCASARHPWLAAIHSCARGKRVSVLRGCTRCACSAARKPAPLGRLGFDRFRWAVRPYARTQAAASVTPRPRVAPQQRLKRKRQLARCRSHRRHCTPCCSAALSL
jgi:hypothetical protein